jgi:heme exporter protein B
LPEEKGTPSANGAWVSEVSAIFKKEIQSELRSKSGLITSGLFSIVSVVAIAFATRDIKITATGAAGLFWITLLFSSMISLPRAFTIEEELGTGDLLRLVARPHAVFWGKVLFNLLLLGATAAALGTLFLLLVDVQVSSPLVFVLALVGSCMSLAGGVTLSGALVAQAANRGALGGAIALPLLMPVTIFGVAGLAAAFGDATGLAGKVATSGLICYGVASISIGPYLFAAVWKT